MSGLLGYNPKTIYDSFAGDPLQDQHTLDEYARVGLATEGSMPTSQNLLDNVKAFPEVFTWIKCGYYTLDNHLALLYNKDKFLTKKWLN